MAEINREYMEHTKYGYTSVFGRSYCYIKCPYCAQETKAFIWSLSGGGKKCECGALHTRGGITFKPIKAT